LCSKCFAIALNRFIIFHVGFHGNIVYNPYAEGLFNSRLKNAGFLKEVGCSSVSK
jgi:hypothetical protein